MDEKIALNTHLFDKFDSENLYNPFSSRKMDNPHTINVEPIIKRGRGNNPSLKISIRNQHIPPETTNLTEALLSINSLPLNGNFSLRYKASSLYSTLLALYKFLRIKKIRIKIPAHEKTASIDKGVSRLCGGTKAKVISINAHISANDKFLNFTNILESL